MVNGNIMLKESAADYFFNVNAQITASMLLISVLVTLLLSQSKNYIAKSKTTEALSVITASIQDLTAHYYETNQWPRAHKIHHYNSETIGSYVASISFDGVGGLHIEFNHQESLLAGKYLSIVASVPKESRAGSIIWVCGYAKPLTGYQLTSASKTDLSPLLLGMACKNSNNQAKETQ
ncbi:MAG: pilin [Kangiellaceae bacterium]|nr:pilin [Kangiellaceae bacterium]MCW8999963.1 pilin [Kangiellaceae bacterium]MCW9016818.1 pilin [Kangiellaceae bacterium]